MHTYHDVLLLVAVLLLLARRLHNVGGIKGGRVRVHGVDGIALGKALVGSRQDDHLLLGQVKDWKSNARNA